MINFILRKHQATIDTPETKTRLGKLSGTVGICSNVFLAIAKLFAGSVSGSVSITADALNNLTDAASSLITLVGFKLSEQPADDEHPYGHARFEYLSALAVSVLIIFIGFELAKTSFLRIINPTAVELSLASGIILVLSILVKLWLSGFNKVLGRAINSSTLIASSVDSRNDVIATSAVLAASLIELFTDWKIDGFMGFAVALFILYSGIMLAKDTISPILGENASPELKEEIVDYISSCPKVLGYHDLMVHDYGMGRRFASLHVEMDKDEDPIACHELIDDMERECKKSHGVELVIHYDPVTTNNPVLDLLREQTLEALREIDERMTLHDFRIVLGEAHTNVIFDAVVPSNLRINEALIKDSVEKSLSDKNGKKFYAVITYDLMTFN